MRKLLVGAALSAMIVATTASAQQRLYTNTFDLSDVELLDGPFKHAQDLNVEHLLQYDIDRLLAPFLLQAGLEPKGELFPNWEGLDGHVGGHYLSALAIHWASTGNKECLDRMNYMLSEMKKCQDMDEHGYVGGVPDSKSLWQQVHDGNVGIIGRYWVPWYNIHKTYAGLRDTWLYAGSEQGREMFLKLCDWGIWVIEDLSAEKMESMLNTEFGGMNEVYADAYQMTGDKKYLDAAKKFTHHQLYDSMLAGVDNLDNKHANTQVPKVVGFARVAQVSADDKADYQKASDYFWDRVVNYRSVAFGGNSRREHFPGAEDYHSYVEEREGPESCNTNNMLKLTEDLFAMDPQARYADFFENALYNHILSTQHPEHGGYVYFTPARPAHYRVYSQPNEGMWCCVGTGMENHGKYGEFIYSHFDNDLYVNLFIASKLNWKEKNVILAQETSFPEAETSVITVNPQKGSAKFRLLVRCPEWVSAGEMKVICGGVDYAEGAKPSSYIVIDRKWKKGDKVEITMPMHLRAVTLDNVPEYVAVKNGPVLLGVKTGTEDMTGLVAGDGRWEHIASGRLISALDAPYIIGNVSNVEKALDASSYWTYGSNANPYSGGFVAPKLFANEKFAKAEMVPFYKIHDSRYSIYYLMMSPAEYEQRQREIAAAEAALIALDNRTVDKVNAGEQQPEADHMMKSENSSKGNHEGQAWRDAKNGGYFEYELNTDGRTDLTLMVRYWGNESERNRRFTILIDGKELASETLFRKWNKAEFQEVEYEIPAEMLAGKDIVTVRFQSQLQTIAGGVFHIRLVRPE